jgi:predicted transcriptional regulator
MANLTVAIDDALLQRAREAAVRENTSVNALVRDFLSRYVDARSQRLQALERFESVAAASGSRSQEPWNSESLHRISAVDDCDQHPDANRTARRGDQSTA